MPLTIREFDETDRNVLIDLARELQAHEANIYDRMKPPGEIGGWYVDRLLEECRAHKGVILLAVIERIVVGYAVLLTKVSSHSTPGDEVPYVHAVVMDLVVMNQYRRRGVGMALLEECERRSLAAGVSWLRISVLSANDHAVTAYSKFGFRDLLITMEKPLG